MGWKTINVASNETLRTYLNNLEIRNENRKIQIPLADIDTIIIESYTSTYSNKLLEALSNYKINVLFCDANHLPFMQLVPINGHHNSLKVLEQQIQWNQKYRNHLWQKIITNKIFNQKATLAALQIPFDATEFNDYIANIKYMDMSNAEGHSAKKYWKLLFGPKFVRDHTAEQTPETNVLLNYGYTILRSMFVRSIVKKGLDPRISIFHRSFSNFFALASDLMEPFRPLVDYLTFGIITNHETNFHENKKKMLDFIANKKVMVDDKAYYLNYAIDFYIEKLQKGLLIDWVVLWE